MSTKLSTDMISSRPSTRTHAPPGGATTISFGDASSNDKNYDRFEKNNMKQNPVAAPKTEPGLNFSIILVINNF